MFFLHELERTISIHPSFFGPNTTTYIRNQLFKDIEGTNTGHYYIVLILDVTADDISQGRVIPGSGFAEYTIHYKAIIWRPFRGEIVDGVVASVVESGFFVEVGPMNVFVAKGMIPSDIKYNGNATPPQWTDNADQVIERGTHIRLKIKGIRTEVDKLYAIATIKEDYLGPLAD